ncbi:MAG: TIGR02281 family clan AA aspartic protease [Alphaproteobacteria bacterium]|nr:TIGR02281 family clan AA aspartic protease [Rhodospirillaceae bacterium]MDG2482856.1 TIGR02281 family clan AA aspartic protease [Alphaproteobacteria bacterium]MBT6205293.1 TIGR02281 family clan AA aspartic protease [Rhodospirillaceae bacterium]MBT6510558.1 TIGR02281 family clan AA aspartic protease [Rhodospirillaceae bacterium]MBT7613192.1 TIGR02281 family clan AA aspartic protease [Rhodospirillaceae bacterium]
MYQPPEEHDQIARRGRGCWVLLVFILAGIVAMAVLWSFVPDGDEARFVYLVLLGLFVGSGVVWALARAPLSRTLRHAGIWLVIGAVVFVGYSFRDEARYVLDRVQGDLVPEQGYGETDGEISFRAGPNGHFTVEIWIDGTPLTMIVDTGASDVVLTREDARLLGLDPDGLNYSLAYNTANGVVMGALVALQNVRLGPIVFADLSASVNEAPMQRSLLGMTFLSRTGGYRVSGDTLTLFAP